MVASTSTLFSGTFNGKFRDECLNEHEFWSLAEARAVIAAWRQDYNHARPHAALGNRTPEEFKSNYENCEFNNRDVA